MISFPCLAVPVTPAAFSARPSSPNLVLIIAVAVSVALAVGFILGYFVGRRSTSGERKAGFRVLPVQGKTDSEVP